jgi:hypothetical protein
MIDRTPTALANNGPRWHDIYIAAVVFLLVWGGCRLYLPAFRASGGRAMSYYQEFGPAVMLACGHGLVNPIESAVPALEAFLLERSDSFDCRHLTRETPQLQLDNLQSASRYLLLAAAAVWRVTGISWTALDSLAATMFAVTLTGAYVVMRFVIGRSLALLGTFVWAISPMHLANVPHLRDYSKAPFFVLTVLAIAVAIRSRTPKALIILGVCFGLVQGIGLGMRTDVGLNFVPFFLALFALGSGDLRINVSWKLVSATLSMLCFVLVAWPVLATYSRPDGLGAWHVSLLGLTTPFDSALNLRRAPYELGYLYDDSYVSTVVHAYWNRVHQSLPVSLQSAGLYHRACGEYYALLVSVFPGDFLTRVFGSTLHVLNLPFSITYGIVPSGVTNSFMTWLAGIRASMMLALSGVGPVAAAYLLLLIGIRDRFAAVVAFLLLAFWAAYPYLQFHGRHVFHLEILTIVVLLWAATLSWRTIAAVRVDPTAMPDRKRVLQSLAVVGALGGVAVVSLGVARLVQRPKVRALLEHYANAPEEELGDTRVLAAQIIRLSPSVFEPAGPGIRVQQAMLVLNVADTCAPGVPVHVRYESMRMTAVDFSRDLVVRSDGSHSSRLFIPVYSVEVGEGRWSRFVSVEVPEAVAPCVRLFRARELEGLPLLLDARLPEDWRARRIYQPLYLGSMLPESVWLRLARWWPAIAELG